MNTSTANRVKVADVVVTDDGIGTNKLSDRCRCAPSKSTATGLYLKAGTR